MDWNDLRYFLAAYRHRTFAGAARELGCEYTTVSRRLTALEDALATRLFTRTRDGVAPTPAAEEMVAVAEEVAARMHVIECRAAAHDPRVSGTVRVTTSETFAAFVIKHLVELRERHPDLVVEVLASNRPLDIARGEADVALRFVETTQRDLVVRKIGEVSWAMYASKAYVARRGVPSPIDDLRGHEVVGFDETLSSVPGARWLAEHGAGATVVFRGSGLRAVLEAAAAGMGLTVLPCQVADPDPALERLAPDVLGSRELSLVVHPDLSKAARVRAVMDFLAEIAARDRALLTG